MEKIRVLDLFSGKGAALSALKELGINVELVGYSEILPHAIKAYKAIHDVDDDSLYLGDVREILTWNYLNSIYLHQEVHVRISQMKVI